ncbi:MAG: error-prone polymerase [Frankiales bacterium]|nr:error-prone polymerase [Frankiales bacterium]
MSDPFVHLHVASGYSMRFGTAHPAALVERAVDHGMDALALTDRDGIYGAVKFVKACMSAGVRPVLGVDLATEPTLGSDGLPASRPTGSGPRGTGRKRVSPARGGAFVDPGHPRVTLLAQDTAGWGSLCRLVSATHLRGERGKPVSTPALVGEHAERLFVLLGPESEVGRALSARRLDLAAELLDGWRRLVPRDNLLIEVVHHRGPGTLAVAARTAGFAQQHGVEAVLTNAVRHLDHSDAPVADVLDASRRLVVLDPRHIDRVNAEGYLKTGKEMADLADEIATAAGDERLGRRLLSRTRQVADRCALDPKLDLGIGAVHFPELSFATNGSPIDVTAPGAADRILYDRCIQGFERRGMAITSQALARLDVELGIIGKLGYPSYFLTVADVVDLIKSHRVRCAARGSGAGSFVNYLLGISDVDPLRYGLVMERFLSPLRGALPDIDIDVESARRMEIYEHILTRYGGDRCVCVSMMDTYRARHAIRDVGAALGLPPDEIDAIAKAFPHIRASQLSAALLDLPELRSSGLAAGRRSAQADQLIRIAERLDGLPRHIALHPCGVLLSDATLLDRTAVEASWLGFPMSQFDKDDVEELGLLKLDVLGIRMQSAIAHAIGEIDRIDGEQVDIDIIPRDDPATFALIQSTRTLGCFQIESPGQRELIGKFAPETFEDLIIDISLFRPGPVKTDMVRPFLEARQGWRAPAYLHPDLQEALEETWGVVVFHEQVLRIVARVTGCSLAEADEVRRRMGDPISQEEVQVWFFPAMLSQGYDLPTVDQMWELLKGFASFGFCKAHAAAFALPTYQSAWLKAHHPAAFLAGVLTHDPGMYPKRLILDDARQFGIAVLPLDVNASDGDYRIERVGVLDEPPPLILGESTRERLDVTMLPDARSYGIRLGLADVKGINDAELSRIVAGRPYHSLSDFWHRAGVSRPVAERLVLAGAFDSLYGISSTIPLRRRGVVTRRDLLLQVLDLDQWSRATARGSGRRGTRTLSATGSNGSTRAAGAQGASRGSPGRDSSGQDDWSRDDGTGHARLDVRAQAARQSQAPATVVGSDVQLALDLGDEPTVAVPSGLPEMTASEKVRAELDILGLDASSHILTFYEQFFAAAGITRARDLLRCRSRAEVLVAGVKVATQTPPVRSGRRVVFVTLDDATGPVDATFFEEAQAGYAATVFHSWLLVIRGTVRRTGPRGVSLQADGCWELPLLRELWETQGMAAVSEALAAPPPGFSALATEGAAESRSTRPVMAPVRRFASGFELSAYSDIRPAGSDGKGAPRRLWHSSPGSSGG